MMRVSHCVLAAALGTIACEMPAVTDKTVLAGDGLAADGTGIPPQEGNPPQESRPAAIEVTIPGLQPGWQLSTVRLTNQSAAAESMVGLDSGPVTLKGTATDVFFAAVTDGHGQVIQTHSMGSLCAFAGSPQLHVPADYPTIQAAVAAAHPGDTVKVAPGTFTEFVKLAPGVCLLGSGADQTILDAQGAGQTLLDLTNAPGSAVVGFTLRGVGPSPGPTSCVDPFSCAGSYYAAALYMGGMNWYDPVLAAPPLVAENVFTGNDIAMMLYWRSTAIVRNNVFRENRHGLIANHFQSRALVSNNVFWNHTGVAIGNQAAYLDIVNNVIAQSAVGIRFSYVQTGWIRCNLFHANAVVQQDDHLVPPRFQLGRDGNLELDPLFIDSSNNNFHLQSGSAAQDTGCFAPTVMDPDGTPEDIGAYGGPLASF